MELVKEAEGKIIVTIFYGLTTMYVLLAGIYLFFSNSIKAVLAVKQLQDSIFWYSFVSDFVQNDKNVLMVITLVLIGIYFSLIKKEKQNNE